MFSPSANAADFFFLIIFIYFPQQTSFLSVWRQIILFNRQSKQNFTQKVSRETFRQMKLVQNDRLKNTETISLLNLTYQFPKNKPFCLFHLSGQRQNPHFAANEKRRNFSPFEPVAPL